MPDSSIIQALRIIEWHEQQKRTAQARRFGRKRKLTGQDLQDAIDALNLPKAVSKMVVSRASTVDRSPEAQEARQHALVDALCNGTRCSLSRAYRIAQYGRHQPSLDARLLTKGIADRFRWHAEQGHPLPAKYKDRILAELGIDPIELQADLEMLGLADP